ncbi:hypothetical protein CIB48_g7969 [Xylaria polymorpha]|nr:hypothetical protein CIB48_g7969 [Xylaria polymorpha]
MLPTLRRTMVIGFTINVVTSFSHTITSSFTATPVWRDLGPCQDLEDLSSFSASFQIAVTLSIKHIHQRSLNKCAWWVGTTCVLKPESATKEDLEQPIITRVYRTVQRCIHKLLPEEYESATSLCYWQDGVVSGAVPLGNCRDKPFCRIRKPENIESTTVFKRESEDWELSAAFLPKALTGLRGLRVLAGRWLVGNEQYNNIAGTGGVARMSRKGKAWGDQNGDKSQWNKKDSWFPADESPGLDLSKCFWKETEFSIGEPNCSPGLDLQPDGCQVAATENQDVGWMQLVTAQAICDRLSFLYAWTVTG